MLRRRDHGRPDGQQPLVGELRGHDRPRAYTPNTDGACAVEYGLDDGARLNVKFEQSCREFLLESSHRGGERRKWKLSGIRQLTTAFRKRRGAVAGLVGIECGVVSGVINLESSGVEASDWRLRHDEHYHEARFLAAGWSNSVAPIRGAWRQQDP